VGGLPLVARVFRNVAHGRETFVSAKRTFEPPVDAMLEAPLIVDRWDRRGPLGGLLSTMPYMRSRLVFAVAADLPFVTSALIDILAAAWQGGDEAVVPVHGDAAPFRLEPLAALYDRAAFLRAGSAEFRRGRSLERVLARLRIRRVWFADASVFANVNTPADYRRVAFPPSTEPGDDG
jgi:molybdopterin-guanine dinucleotide biosynthesis protein A